MSAYNYLKPNIPLLGCFIRSENFKILRLFQFHCFSLIVNDIYLLLMVFLLEHIAYKNDLKEHIYVFGATIFTLTIYTFEIF